MLRHIVPNLSTPHDLSPFRNDSSQFSLGVSASQEASLSPTDILMAFDKNSERGIDKISDLHENQLLL